ncbi:MAG: hypothetical protein K5880_11740 [Hydrogenophaga sp.]|uniref:hypothetical protein n=1 Tax=Hydrogenophaga sp. TaxID=1904254 RepID=UPI0026349DC6|nr:hypothetical protein [Hydrogenophaga sp.]MCV0439297.1 hypothetical protein [Hydrogenophaga sp.]
MKTTQTDIHLARVFYDILLDHARTHPGKPIRYKEVLDRACHAHPGDACVAGAIPVSIGRRLEVIVQFTREHELPPLTCIAVNESGRPGESYKTVLGSWDEDMETVARYGWSDWQGKWDLYVETAYKVATPLKRRRDDVARQLVHEEYVARRIPKLDLDAKEQLVELLRDGLSFRDAWSEIQGLTS